LKEGTPGSAEAASSPKCCGKLGSGLSRSGRVVVTLNRSGEGDPESAVSELTREDGEGKKEWHPGKRNGTSASSLSGL